MKTFSVLTVSKRRGWERGAEVCLHDQTAHPKEWVIVTEDSYSHSSLQSWNNTKAIHVSPPPKTKASNLNASLNTGLRYIDTDYVIFYQDFIELQPDCFKKLLDLATPRTFVTTCTPNYDGSDDGRYTHVDGPRSCRPEEWEANVAIAPMAILRELGGFDEDYDNGWSWDNVNIAQRAAMLGCKFIVDESNRPKLLPHELTSKLELTLNLDRHMKNMKAIREGKKPLRLDFLS